MLINYQCVCRDEPRNIKSNLSWVRHRSTSNCFSNYTAIFSAQQHAVKAQNRCEDNAFAFLSFSFISSFNVLLFRFSFLSPFSLLFSLLCPSYFLSCNVCFISFLNPYFLVYFLLLFLLCFSTFFVLPSFLSAIPPFHFFTHSLFCFNAYLPRCFNLPYFTIFMSLYLPLISLPFFSPSVSNLFPPFRSFAHSAAPVAKVRS